MEVVQRGILQYRWFYMAPTTGELWFTDNGRDMMGDDMPNCELNRASKDGLHFGYPYCHEGSLRIPSLAKTLIAISTNNRFAKMEHTQLRLAFVIFSLQCFPTATKCLFIARHGSWNRTEKSGYDVQMVKVDDHGKLISMEPFMTGWLSDNKQDVWAGPWMCNPTSMDLYWSAMILPNVFTGWPMPKIALYFAYETFLRNRSQQNAWRGVDPSLCKRRDHLLPLDFLLHKASSHSSENPGWNHMAWSRLAILSGVVKMTGCEEAERWWAKLKSEM